jgi:enoyl-[acyl-carrier protein] reductase I
MTVDIPRPVLKDMKALVVGVANESSIAWGCAKAFHELGASLAITYLNDKARPHVEPLAKSIEAPIFLPLDVAVPGQLEAVFDRIGREWGELDILVHSIAFAPKEDLQGGSQLLGRRFRESDGRVVSLVRPHGAARSP